MSNVPKKPFVYYTTSLPPLSSELGVSQATSHINGPLPPSTPRKDSLFDIDLESYKGSKRVSFASYNKVLGDAIKLLQLPSAPLPPPDVLRKKFADALSTKFALAAALADAEQKCYDWESAIRQALGENEVQKIFQEHGVVGVDEVDTVRGQYMTAIIRIKMRDFCMSRKGPVSRVGLSPNSLQAPL